MTIQHRAVADRVRQNRRRSEATAAALSRLPLDVVDRRNSYSPRAAAAMRAFAAQPQPLSPPPARHAAAEPVPIERIEQRLRESITLVTERTVRRELERTLSPGAALNRRLRESIQSEMYDDIVLERERLGGRS